MTVEEMLTGVRKPMSNEEFNYWMAFNSHRAALEEAARQRAQNR